MPFDTAEPNLNEEGRALVEQLGGRWTLDHGMCRCPAHEDRNPSLSVRIGRSRLLLHCFAGCGASEILRALMAAGLLQRNGGAPRSDVGRPPRAASLSAAAMRVWGGAHLLSGTPGQRYLSSRGIHTSSPELRYHPRTPHGPKPFTRFRPALIAAVRDDTGLVGVHRTFLDLQGDRSATLPDPRCGLGRFGQGAVRLGGAAVRLGLAEGIETALSATLLFGLPCWATLGTERFAHVALPPEASELLLFLDNDHGGRRAEALAREAFAHLPAIEAHYPPVAGQDWNDVLRALVAARAMR